VLSVATNSDILATLFNIDLDIEKIIYSIAFHDIVEALIGDTPEFTSKELIKFSQKYSVNTKEKAIQEQKANNQIIKMLPKEMGSTFNSVRNFLDEEQNPQSEIARFIWFADKTEPITAVWRYIFNYKNRINIDIYIEAMSDFYTNPKILSVYSYSENTSHLIKYLQFKENSKEYFLKGERFLKNVLPLPLIERPFVHTLDI
jgi:5'-deoxynucleotidase YfbR-like HD superfamily hydrolase